MDFGGVRNLDELSQLLGFSSQNLYYLIDLRDNLYSAVNIPKSSGVGTRRLHIPIPELRGVQKQILRIILQDVEPHFSAMAYRRGFSVVDAAKQLCGPNYLLKMDIADFFPSISSRRVFCLFRSLGFNDVVAYLLTQLTTYQDALVQGAPTSPAISNLVFRSSDNLLSKLSNTWSIKYKRYCDDLFFVRDASFKHRHFSLKVQVILREGGFRINTGKTRYFHYQQPRYTLGLLTHERRVALPRETRRNYRAAFYRASRDVSWGRDNYSRLCGMAEWYRAVYGKDAKYIEYCSIIKNIKSLKVHSPYLV